MYVNPELDGGISAAYEIVTSAGENAGMSSYRASIVPASTTDVVSAVSEWANICSDRIDDAAPLDDEKCGLGVSETEGADGESVQVVSCRRFPCHNPLFVKEATAAAAGRVCASLWCVQALTNEEL